MQWHDFFCKNNLSAYGYLDNLGLYIRIVQCVVLQVSLACNSITCVRNISLLFSLISILETGVRI